MVLSIKDAKYKGQEVFKVKGKWVVSQPMIGFVEITSYAKKNKYLTPLYEEVKGSEGLGFATFDMKLKIQNDKGTITGEAKAVGQTTSLNNTIDIPADMITWEGGFICATVLPPDENLSYSYSIFAICEEHGFDKLKTEPLKFAGKEEITYKNGKVECNKFIGKLRESNVYFWVDKNRRLIKGLAGDNDEINLTDKNDALTMPEDKESKIKELIQQLKNKDWNIRVSAAEKLGKLNAKEAIPQLTELFNNDADYLVRIAVSLSLDLLSAKPVLNPIEPMVPIIPRRKEDFGYVLRYYRDVLISSPNDIVNYYWIATIYDENLDDPAHAIWCYTKYLEFSPYDASDREKIKKLIDDCRKRLKRLDKD